MSELVKAGVRALAIFGIALLIAAAQPVQLVRGTEPFGWLIVAKPETELREQWLTLFGRLALALAVGIALGGVLFLWLSRRLTEPVRVLTRATEEVAHA